MVLFDHFTELRIRISYIFFSLLITFLASSFFSLELIYLFVKPFLGLNKGFIFTDLTEALYTTLKICLIISFFLLSPFILYQFWCFFTPSLYTFEKQKIKKLYFFVFFGFFFGFFFEYFCILPSLFQFLLQYEIKSPLITLVLEARMSSYVKWSINVFIIVCLLFQIPTLFFLLFSLNSLKSQILFKNRKYWFLFFILSAAFLSPPDFLIQLLIISLFVFLFEFLVWFCFLFEKQNKIKEKKSIY